MEKCEICEKEFDTPSQLRGHMMAHKRSIESRVDEKKERKKRTPLGVMKLKLQAKKLDGKTPRWLNDHGSRIQDALDGGYEFRKDKEGNKVSRVVGTNEDGSERIAFLMDIDNKFYEEDQAEKMKRIDKTEEQIYAGIYDKKPGEKRYVPKDGINVTVSNTPPS